MFEPQMTRIIRISQIASVIEIFSSEPVFITLIPQYGRPYYFAGQISVQERSDMVHRKKQMRCYGTVFSE